MGTYPFADRGEQPESLFCIHCGSSLDEQGLCTACHPADGDDYPVDGVPVVTESLVPRRITAEEIDSVNRALAAAWPEAIVIVLEGGLVQGVYSASGSPRPVVVIDYDGTGDEVPQPDGGTAAARVSDYSPALLHPVISEFARNYYGGTHE